MARRSFGTPTLIWSPRGRRGVPRLLGPGELPQAAAFAQQAGAHGVLAGARIADVMERRTAWGEVWGFGPPGDLRSICWFGGTLVPVGVAGADVAALAAKVRSRGRGCASIVGEASGVLELWRLLEPHWPTPRSVRPDQPLLEITRRADVAPDPLVRRARPDEIETVLPAAAAMFTEELGFSPLRDGSGYRHRVADLLARGMTYIRTHTADGAQTDPPGRVVFKTDLGAAIGGNTQVHGVWVNPADRGRHLARHGIATVVNDALDRGFTSVSLYVNAFNTPALAAYNAVGFTQMGTWATVMF
ncbi:MAG: GNAT family N-acetyltransferase [Bifidobacteriaceae bacterium]|jgi:predicted GNAT family acetyltransferase|nr:GNAT family N-acetyltransferase [Bifidobacteriaceae bacterium]